MKNKFEFYDIVKVIGNKSSLKKIHGCTGVIRGMAQDEATNKWGYAVSIPATKSAWDIDEEDLEFTGKKANPEDFKPVGIVRVRVNPETGEGEIIEDDEE